jgi:hypothetical protein
LHFHFHVNFRFQITLPLYSLSHFRYQAEFLSFAVLLEAMLATFLSCVPSALMLWSVVALMAPKKAKALVEASPKKAPAKSPKAAAKTAAKAKAQAAAKAAEDTSAQASEKRKQQSVMSSNLANASKRVKEGKEIEGDIEKCQLLEKMQAMGKFDPEKNEILSLYQSDKSFKWLKSYFTEQVRGTITDDKSTKGYGSKHLW